MFSSSAPAETLKTQASLLSKIRRDDEDGWNRFYDLYQNFIYATAKGAGLSHEEAKDIVQETMITIRNYVSGFVLDERRGKFRTWMRRIVQSRIIDQYRKKKRSLIDRAAIPSPVEDSETSTALIHRIPDLNGVEFDRFVDAKFEESILIEARKAAKQKVRMEDYQAYDLFHVQELTATEVAVSLDIAIVTVRVRSHRVRKVVEKEVRRIAKALEKTGV